MDIRTIPDSEWFGNPNALEISYNLYLREKSLFAGTLISSILYGARKRFPPAHPVIHAYCLVYSVYSRDACRAVLQVYDSTV